MTVSGDGGLSVASNGSGALEKKSKKPSRRAGEVRLTRADITGSRVVNKLLGSGGTARELEAAKDARAVFDATLLALPSADALTVGLVADLARCRALGAFWTVRSEQEGLATDEGYAAAQRADRYAARAERLSVTVLAVAKEQAARSDKSVDAHAALVAAVAEEGA